MRFIKKLKSSKSSTIILVLCILLLGYAPALLAECNESGDYLICEDWDSGSPPAGWPDKGDPSWNGWEPADYGNVASNSGDIITNKYNSPGRSLVLIKGVGKDGVTDLTHRISGSPSKIFIRFYLLIPEGETRNVGSFAHVVFLNNASSAEVAIDFRKHGEYNGTYYDSNPDGDHYMVIHSYAPEVWIANNQGSRGNRDYFVWEDHEGEWVCVEWMVDFGNDRTSLWLNGVPHVIDYAMDFSYSSASSIILSGFTLNTSGEINFHYDDIVVNTSYIGLRGENTALQPVKNLHLSSE